MILIHLLLYFMFCSMYHLNSLTVTFTILTWWNDIIDLWKRSWYTIESDKPLRRLRLLVCRFIGFVESRWKEQSAKDLSLLSRLMRKSRNLFRTWDNPIDLFYQNCFATPRVYQNTEIKCWIQMLINKLSIDWCVDREIHK